MSRLKRVLRIRRRRGGRFQEYHSEAVVLSLFVLWLLSAPAQGAYCDASGSNYTYEHISRVQVGDIDNATGGSNYSDYTHLSTTMDIGAGYQITVTNAYPYDQYDLCGVWVDWNQDEDFDDAAETISVSPDQTTAGGGVITFVGTITPPAGAAPGSTRMRVRILWYGTISPCGTTTWGEVEDYTINVAAIGEIHGTKFHDLNGNGIAEDDEPGLEGWTVFLDSDRNGQLDAGEPSTVTDLNGHYVFADLTEGTYTVAELVPEGWVQTLPGWVGERLFGVQIDSTNDITLITEFDPCDMTPVNSFQTPYPPLMIGTQGFAAGPTSLFYADFGYRHPDFGALVWELDANNGAVIDSDIIPYEQGYFCTGAAYFRDKVYITKVQQQAEQIDILVWDPAQDMVVDTITVATSAGDGLAGAADSNVILATKWIDDIIRIDPATGAILETIDPCGVRPSLSLAYVDGTMIMGSAFQNPPTVYRIDPDSGEVLETLQLPAKGSLTALAGDGLPARNYRVALEAGQSVRLDFGNVESNSAKIRGTKWNDLNADGIRDQNEPVLEGWKIYIDSNENGRWDEGEPYDLTDSGGNYELAGLTGGAHAVAEANQIDWQQTYPGGDASHTVRIAVGRTIENIDFGNTLINSGRIRGTIWNDANGNSQYDPCEPYLQDRVVYIDLNNDGLLNAGEPNTVSNESGHYEFAGLAPGPYSVATVHECGWHTTMPLFTRHRIISVSNSRDLAFDSKRQLLYIGTAGGRLERYNLYGGELLSPYSVGTALNGMDITSDCNWIYAVEKQYSNPAILHKVSLDTGTVTDLTYSVDGHVGEYGFDIKMASNNLAFLTTNFGGSGWLPLRQVDLTTDTITERTDIPGASWDEIPQGIRIFRGMNRNLLVLSEDWIYEAPADSFAYDPRTSRYMAVNSDESLIAQGNYTLVQIFARDFSPVVNIRPEGDSSYIMAGMVFNPSRNLLYYGNQHTQQIIALNTKTWMEAGHIDIPEGISGYVYDKDKYKQGVMGISNDGRFLAVTRSDDVSLLKIDGSHTVDVNLAETVSEMSFGYRRNMVGDSDGDQDVDIRDMMMLCTDWLQAGVNCTDFVPHEGDGIVNMLDFAASAYNWLAGTKIFLDFDEDFETGDFSRHTWVHSGDTFWTVDSESSFEGTYSARSGIIGNSQTSNLEITLDVEDGYVAFFIYTSCSLSGDYLRFYIDGVDQWQWGGFSGWYYVRFPVPAGTRTFKWSYEKDDGGVMGSDVVRIDAIQFPPLAE